MTDTSVIRERFTAVERALNERSRRLLAAAEARTAGYGGIAAVSRATGVARRALVQFVRSSTLGHFDEQKAG
jgi:DNA-binding phage protein